jgi:hypothetical protein
MPRTRPASPRSSRRRRCSSPAEPDGPGRGHRRHAVRGGGPPRRYRRGAVVGGTSAGASVLAEHMVAFGSSGSTPKKPARSPLGRRPGAAAGGGRRPHFGQRNRYGRLLALVRAEPELLGVGIDEDTAACGLRRPRARGRRPRLGARGRRAARRQPTRRRPPAPTRSSCPAPSSTRCPRARGSTSPRRGSSTGRPAGGHPGDAP